MPEPSVVAGKAYKEATLRLRQIVAGAVTRHVERPVLLGQIDEEIRTTINAQVLRKADGPRLHGYAEALVMGLETTHTERRCWHVTSRTWRPVAEGDAYRASLLPSEAGVYDRDRTVTFWRPGPDDRMLTVYNGAVADGSGTLFSELDPIDPYTVLALSETAEYRRRDGVTVLALPGRHGAGQFGALYAQSGLFAPGRTLVHTPFLVFLYDVNLPGFRVTIAKTVSDLLAFPDDTAVMAQWPGRTRSDWFWFKIDDLRLIMNS